jgi:hypothetical protein
MSYSLPDSTVISRYKEFAYMMRISKHQLSLAAGFALCGKGGLNERQQLSLNGA